MTPAERLRKNQRLLDKAIRELEQQRVKLEKQEKTLVAQIKQSAQKGQIGACKIQAMDLVRTRRFAARNRSPSGNPAHTAHAGQIRGEVLRHAEPTAEDISPTPGATTMRRRLGRLPLTDGCRPTEQTSR